MKAQFLGLIFLFSGVSYGAEQPSFDFDHGGTNVSEFRKMADSIEVPAPAPDKISTKFFTITDSGTLQEILPENKDGKDFVTFMPNTPMLLESSCGDKTARASWNVCVDYQIKPNFGGHNHTSNIPLYTDLSGKPIPNHYCKNNIPLNTSVRLEFKLSQFSARTYITSSYSGACQGSVSHIVDTKVDNLILLDKASNDAAHGYIDYYVLTGTTTNHKINHFGKPQSIDLLKMIAWKFYAKFKTKLRINDMSLIWGGLFDFKGDWKPQHYEHRYGRQADIGRTDMTPEQQEALVKFACETGVQPMLESKSGELIEIGRDINWTRSTAPHFEPTHKDCVRTVNFHLFQTLKQTVV